MGSASHSRGKSETKYPYKDLEPGNWIRILHLDAGSDKSEPLIAELDHLNLTKQPTGKTKAGPADGQDDIERSTKYEALSWTWGDQRPVEPLRLRDKNGRQYINRIAPNLANALRCLRKPLDRRTIWVDAVCINMDNPEERARQVAQMNLVYSRAFNVCIWLDEDIAGNRYGYTTTQIFDFVEKQLLDLANFDQIIKAKRNARIWVAFVQLMTKKWFSRRWIIQEVALARKATVHSGDAMMKWETFAHAVSLFVRAEAADHQLSKIVSTEELLITTKQGAFWDVDRMGAVSLVEITNTNFNNSGKGVIEPTSSLETLMSMLSMFEARKACDTIYALLAIAKDTAPEAEGTRRGVILLEKAFRYTRKYKSTEEGLRKLHKAQKVAEMLAAGLRSKPYPVSYTKPPIDVYKDFVEFCVYQSRSLDIICRPWAPKPDLTQEHNQPARADTDTFEEYLSSSSDSNETDDTDSEDERPDEIWLQEAQRFIREPPPMSSPPSLSGEFGFHNSLKRMSTQMNGDSDIGESGDQSGRVHRPRKRPRTAGPVPRPQKFTQAKEMPSWIADRVNIAFHLSTDEYMSRMERKNADPLVGLPHHAPYNASGARQVRMGKVQFRRRGEYDQSLFVEGFVLDTVAEMEQPADLSNIPPNWYKFVDYGPEATKRPPPLELYRTLIADRGPNGTRPPPYYIRAFNEAVKNRTTTLDVKDAMNEGRSIMTEFLERIRQVTFNRRLIKTHVPMKYTKEGRRNKPRLGLAPIDTRSSADDPHNPQGGGDLICILYGLSVPVIMRKYTKLPEEKERDRQAQEEQLPEATRNAVRVIEKYYSFWRAMKEAVYSMKYEWEPYQDQMPQWRDDLRSKFSKLWLQDVERDFSEREQRAKLPVSPPRVPGRFEGDLSQEQKDRLWMDMRDTWKKWLETGAEYPWKNGKMLDWPIMASSKSPDEYYKLIGEAYIDQMMDGEALTFKQNHSIPDMVFEIR